MKNKSIIVSLVINLVISILKFISGFIFNVSSLFADGIYTLIDFLTNLFSIISDNIAKKRKTKKHPLGYGMIQYILRFVIGFITFLVGIYIFVRSFHVIDSIPSINVIYIIALSFILKFISIFYLRKEGLKENNKNLLFQANSAKTDLYSTLMVFFIILVLQFGNLNENIKYIDNIGSFIISFMIFKTAFIIIKDSFYYLVGSNDIDDIKYNKVYKIINNYKNIELKNVEFISYGPYYLVDIDLYMDPNTTLRKVTKIEKEIIRKLKVLNLNIKLVNINTEAKES